MGESAGCTPAMENSGSIATTTLADLEGQRHFGKRAVAPAHGDQYLGRLDDDGVSRLPHIACNGEIDGFVCVVNGRAGQDSDRETTLGLRSPRRGGPSLLPVLHRRALPPAVRFPARLQRHAHRCPAGSAPNRSPRYKSRACFNLPIRIFPPGPRTGRHRDSFFGSALPRIPPGPVPAKTGLPPGRPSARPPQADPPGAEGSWEHLR